MGLLLEVTATLLTAAQAVSAGAFQETFCDQSIYVSEQLQLNCDEVELSEVSQGLVSDGSRVVYSYPWLPTHNFTSCDSSDKLLLSQNCVCTFETEGGFCSWTPMMSIDEFYLHSLCFAYPPLIVELATVSETYSYTSGRAFASCLTVNP